VIAMNRAPIAVKVRPIWRRVRFRLGMNPKIRTALDWLPDVPEIEYEGNVERLPEPPETGEAAA
jgi:hypothetical protein